MSVDWNSELAQQLDWHWREAARLDEVYAAWLAGVRGLGDEGLARPCGPADGGEARARLV